LRHVRAILPLAELNNVESSSGPTKRILVLSYSQTGQLTRLVERIIEPLREGSTIEVRVEALQPVKPFPFPWNFFVFFDAFPESAHMVPPPLVPLTLDGSENFDLVILPYQVWFLAPSQPVTAFLKSEVAKKLLAGKPVVTVIACRNMWLMAQEKMKGLLAACGARLLDNVVLTDPSPTMVSVLTTPLWLLTGKRDYIRSLPPAGVPEVEIQAARRFGLALRDALHADRERGNDPLLAGLGAVNADPHLLFSEKVITRSFFLWGKLLRAVGKPGQTRRIPFLTLYVAFLIAMLLTVVPISLTVQALLRPFMGRRFAAIKQKYEVPSGSGKERMLQYEQ
jgi:hypothetical protein